MKGQSGLTLIELMVSLAIILLVIAAATAAYLKVLTTYKTQGAMSENFMGNLTGFELLRYDLEMAGYGLPQSNTLGVSYSEALAKGSYPATAAYTPPYDPSVLNEASLSNTNGPPHAFALSTTAGEATLSGNTSAVLAIKSTVADINTVSGHFGLWTGAQMENGGTIAAGDHFVLINAAGNWVPSQSSLWDFSCSSVSGTAVTASPALPGSGNVYFMYGLSSSKTTRMPFNRVDYYLDNNSANHPSYCAKGTFELYRSVVNQADGTLTASPVIDCVEDFQVAFGIDPSGNGTKSIVWQSDLGTENIGGSKTVLMTPAQMQQYLREVKVFVLYQKGRGTVSTTSDYTFSGSLSLGAQDSATNGLSPLGGNKFTPSAISASKCPQCTHYRWEAMEIDAKPMNLRNVTW